MTNRGDRRCADACDRIPPGGTDASRTRQAIRQRVTRLVVVVALLLSVTSPMRQPASAASQPASSLLVAQLQPDWMTPDQAQQLDLGFPVLVPPWIPVPFGPEPYTIEAASGYYRLYWLITGGDPTFFEIVGVVGGDIPDYSSYDRNNQLVVNAEVRGYPAYHDLTPIYDWVWWQEGDVVYSLNSRGLTDVSAVDVANALVELVPPAPAAELYAPASVESGQIGTLQPVGVSAATLVADAGVFLDTGTAEYDGAGEFDIEWVAPSVETDTIVTFSLLDPNSGALLASAQTTVVGVPAPPVFDLTCPAQVNAGETASVTVSGSGSVTVDHSAGSWPISPPNTDYDPNTDGTTIRMTMPESGSASLVWQAPSSAQTATLQVAGPSGMTVAECAISVQDATASTATVSAETPGATVPPRTSTPPATRPPGGPTPTITATRVAGSTGDEPAAGVPTISAPGGSGDASTESPQPTPAYPRSDGTDGPQNPVYWGQPKEDEAGANGNPPTSSVTPSPGDGIDIPGGGTSPAPTSGAQPEPPATSTPGDETPTFRLPTATPTRAAPTAQPTQISPTAPATAPTATMAAPTEPPMTPAVSTAEAPFVFPTATPTQRPPTATSVPSTATATSAPTTTPELATSTAAPEQPSATRAPTLTPTAPAIPTFSVATATPTSEPPTPTVSPTIEPSPTATADLVPSATAAATATLRPIPAIPTATPTPGPTQPPTATPPLAVATSSPATPDAIASPRLAHTATSAATATRVASPVATEVASPAVSPLVASPESAPSATVEPTAPATPTVPLAADVVEQMIGPDGGTVTHPAGAALVIPARALSTPVKVIIRSVPDADLPVSSDVDLIPGTGFELQMVQQNGTEVVLLPVPVRFQITPTQRELDEDAMIYRISGDQLEPVRTTSLVGTDLVANLDHFSRYVAGVPINEQSDLGVLPWILAAAAALSGLIVIGLLVRSSRQQRPRRRWRNM